MAKCGGGALSQHRRLPFGSRVDARAFLFRPVWPWLRRRAAAAKASVAPALPPAPTAPAAPLVSYAPPRSSPAGGGGGLDDDILGLDDTVVVLDAQLAAPPQAPAQAVAGQDPADADAGEPAQSSLLTRPAWQRDFWRWSAGVGWTLDVLLLAWAIFLRQSGLVEEGIAAPGSAAQSAGSVGAAADASPGAATGSLVGTRNAAVAAPLDDTMYATLLRRNLGEEQSLTVSDGVLGGLLRDESRNLGRLVDGLKAALPEPGPPPPQGSSVDWGVRDEEQFEDLKLLTLIDDLKAKVSSDRDFLRQRDAELLNELQEKPSILFKLSERVMERRRLELEPPQPSQASAELPLGDLASFASGAVLPFSVVLGAVLLTAVLSQQMLRVATVWREQRVSDGDKRRRRWGQRVRYVLGMVSTAADALAKGELSTVEQKCDDVGAVISRWARGPTWEELARAELVEFWERWGPQAWGLRLTLPPRSPGARNGRSFLSGLLADPAGLADQWRTSVEVVARRYGEAFLAAWAKDADDSQSQAAAADAVSDAERVPVATALVIRIFGGWGRRGRRGRRGAGTEGADWVNIANIPLSGDWREKALRLLIPAEEDKRDVPIVGDMCEALLTTVVASQVSRVVGKSVWGSLTTDLWQRYGYASTAEHDGAPFQIGYEVVEVAAIEEEEMLATARAMPRGGERVVRVPQVEAQIREQRH